MSQTNIKIELYTDEIETYRLLDSGNQLKLEQIGPYRIIRSEPRAWWRRSLPQTEWDKAVAIYDKEDAQEWRLKMELENELELNIHDTKALIRFSKRSKQIGIFPEQYSQWKWIEKNTSTAGDINVLNLFGYTGLSTLFAARAGAKVTHVDGSKPVIDWARANQKRSGLDDKPIRWILDDAQSFVQREIKRGVKYDAIIMDPPSFGRGPKGEVWKIEDDLPTLLYICREVLSENPHYIILNLYSTELSSISLFNLLSDITFEGRIDLGEMCIKQQESDRILPLSVFARWSK